MAGTDPITREAVAKIRDTVAQAPAAASVNKPGATGPGRAAQLLSRATGLCDKLDAALTRLGQTNIDTLPGNDVATLRQRVAQLASRIGE